MKATIKRMDEEILVIDFHTKNGVRTLEINATDTGYRHEDFSNWDITDDEYYKIEEMVDNIGDMWMSDDEIVYDLD